MNCLRILELSAKKKQSELELKPVSIATVFEKQFRDDLKWWFQNDEKRANKVLELVTAITQDPFIGIGKPEPLKHLGSDVWSRRISGEHRLVYRLEATTIYFLQARYHY